jgi:hypothetical protein
MQSRICRKAAKEMQSIEGGFKEAFNEMKDQINEILLRTERLERCQKATGKQVQVMRSRSQTPASRAAAGAHGRVNDRIETVDLAQQESGAKLTGYAAAAARGAEAVQNNNIRMRKENLPSVSAKRVEVDLHEDTDNANPNPWVLPKPKKRAQTFVANNVTPNEGGLRGVIPKAAMFVFGLEPETTEEMIIAHCQMNGVQVVSCETKSHENAFKKSFKVVVERPAAEELRKNGFWPEWVQCRRWQRPRVSFNG